MAKTFAAPFAQDPNALQAVVTTACSGINSTTPTNTSLIATAGVNGALLTSLTAIPRRTASSRQVFSSLASGVTKNLKNSFLKPAQTVSTTAAITGTNSDTVAIAKSFVLNRLSTFSVAVTKVNGKTPAASAVTLTPEDVGAAPASSAFSLAMAQATALCF